MKPTRHERLNLEGGLRPTLLQRDEHSVLTINDVRTIKECWLEFQAQESLQNFPLS